ncbi:MAG TPA: S-methyl-5-thioribose-1-phosphate isomerase, partial [Pseudonocardia sp.]|nr:S-methyl-5-thioribose-1-phosphate isomerase [Pseudonocardia sp.]
MLPPTIAWADGRIVLVDQTALPAVRVVRIESLDVLVDAIRRLVVRGAPALGAAGALGVAL